MFEMHEIPIIGTNLFCPDCSRPLVTFGEDGCVAIHGKAAVRGYMGGEIAEDGSFELPDEAVFVEAVCLRRNCRVKRAVRSIKDGVKDKLAQTTTRRKR